jgi:hypothetical protein
MKKIILLLTLLLGNSSSCIVNAALPIISDKDQKSILHVISNIKPLLNDVLEEIKTQTFSNKPNDVSASIPENIKHKIEDNQRALAKAFGEPKDRPIQEYMKRTKGNKNKLNSADFLKAAKALRHIDPGKSYFQVDPRGDLLAEDILTSKVIPSFLKKDLQTPKGRAQLAEAFYELSQVYSHFVDFGKFKKSQEDGSDTYHFELYDKKSKPTLNKDLQIDMKKILTSRQKLLRYAITLAPDSPTTLNAWARIIEINDSDRTNQNPILSTGAKHSELYLLAKSENWENFINTTKEQRAEKKALIQKILKARQDAAVERTLNEDEKQLEECLQVARKKWIPTS